MFLALWLLFVARHHNCYVPLGLLDISYLHVYYPIAYPLPL